MWERGRRKTGEGDRGSAALCSLISGPLAGRSTAGIKGGCNRRHLISMSRSRSIGLRSRAADSPGLWFLAALLPLVCSQIIRLFQKDAGAWLIADYCGRVAALTTLALIRPAREVAFRALPLRLPWREVLAWIISFPILYVTFRHFSDRFAYYRLPDTRLGHYPSPRGWVGLFDLVFGLALVAYSEEVIFRRCTDCVFGKYIDDKFTTSMISALLFGAYHWWTGIPNIFNAVIFGVTAMIFYRQCQSLWPVIVVHYIIDLASFAG